MPDWHHTHDIHYRGRCFPVMGKVYVGLSLMFRSDGAVEWLRQPGGEWRFRGTVRDGMSIRAVPGAAPAFLLPQAQRAIDELPAGVAAGVVP